MHSADFSSTCRSDANLKRIIAASKSGRQTHGHLQRLPHVVVGQLVDIAIFQSAKRLTQSRHIWLRSTGSTLISQLIDTVIVTYVAFYGKIPTARLHQAATTSYVVKVLLAIGLTPVIYALHALIHRRMHLEEHPADAQRVRVDIP